MTKLRTIIGLSLLAGGALFAQDNITSNEIEKTLYPREYAQKGHFIKNDVQTLAKSSISNNSLKAIYPDDTFVYSQSENKVEVVVSQLSSVSNDALKAIYPDDIFVYSKN